MKSTEFKKLIKESVREVFNEELKNILLEALSTKKTISENYTTSSPKPEIKKSYDDIINETKMSFTSDNVSSFVPPPNFNPTTGELPPGELNINQIMGLIK